MVNCLDAILYCTHVLMLQKETLGIHEDENGRGGAAALLIWEEVAAAPVARLDGAAVQIANLLYVFAGYATIDEVRCKLGNS